MINNELKQKGFTLVELLVSLTLGLLVSAAAMQLFYTGQKSAMMQQGSSNLLNSGYFGLDYIVRDLRLANLGASQPLVNNSTLHGGIVLAKANISTATTLNLVGQSDVSGRNMLTTGNIGPTNLNDVAGSDQLVIQFKNEVNNQFDCQGNRIPQGNYVIQRYFLREDANASGEPNDALALACVAATYNQDNLTTLNLSGNGEIIIPRVDHFHVLLGVATDTMNESVNPAVAGQDGILDRFGYISIENYKALTVKPQIVSIKLGLLVRSPNTVGRSDLAPANATYNIFDVSGSLTPDPKNDLYLRRVVTQTIALRNGFGLKE